MGNDEKTLLITLGIALVALLVARFRPEPQYIEDFGGRVVNNRNYNVINWRGVSAVASVLPMVSAGQNGISTNVDRSPWAEGTF